MSCDPDTFNKQDYESGDGMLILSLYLWHSIPNVI